MASQTTDILFRVSTTTAPQIDMDNMIIRDVIMAQVGEAKGHRFHVEASFIADLVDMANSALKGEVKSNFGHNWDNLGKQLGKFQNVRVVKDMAVGDLQLYKAANDSPRLPGMADFVLKQAAEDNCAIMCSIRFRPDHYYQYDSKGKKLKVWYWDDDGNWVSPYKEFGKVYVAIRELVSCDIVDEGALTERLFSSTNLAERFIDIMSHPDFAGVLDENYESFTVLNEFYKKKHSTGILNQVKALFKKDEGAQKLKDMEKKLENTQDELTDKTEQLEESQAEVEKVEDQLKSQADQIAALTNRITELEKAPVDKHTTGDDEVEPTESEERLWENSPINQRAMKIFKSHSKEE